MNLCGQFIVTTEIDEGDRGTTIVLPDLPFVVQRQIVVQGVGSGTERGGHAHRNDWQAIWCLQGHMKIILRRPKLRPNELDRHVVIATPPAVTVVRPLTWVDLCEFSPDCIYAVWFNSPYDPERADYIDTFEELEQIYQEGECKSV